MSCDAVPRKMSQRISAGESVELTILMPCLNETETLAICINKATAYLERAGIDGEVLIADNGSNDGSQEIARSLGARVVDVSSRGYGNALIAGIAAAHGEFVIMGDADDSYDFSDLDAFVTALRSGNELVMGNRFKGGIAEGAMPPLHRYLGNPVLSFIGRLFFKSKIGDFHCGLRGFRRDAISDLQLESGGMEFASEMVVKSELAHLTIAEVPTTLRKDGRSRPPHLRTWTDGWRHLRFLLLCSPRWLFFYPGLVLMAIALVSGILIETDKLTVANARFGMDSLVVAAGLLIIGVQAVLFSVLTHLYGEQAGFLPRNQKVHSLRSRISLESGVGIGAVLALVGVVMLVVAFILWQRSGFGSLNVVSQLHLVVPAVTLLVVGVQISLSSAFMGILLIKHHD
jgi:glycosyltransferase involved in cell wall biosynthesis